jgi:Flp pilus assembly protein TadB
MMDLITGGGGILTAIAAAIAVMAGAFFTGRSSGVNRERARSANVAVKQWKKADEHIGQADEARRDARNRADADLMSDDGFKRPRR